MNRHLHRVVFNAARGLRMAVQETAASTGKGASRATTVAGAAAVAGALIAGAAHAQIVGAPNVPGNLRPTVLTAPNGVPLVNIQTPSAAGVSRNVYNQFNVGANGAILNNSRVNVQTQLGGFVQGNPFLASGPARIILNEVNGGTPSQLRGYIEVGGQRAEVIIANPAGISVDGGGFINASRATLTTGTPQFNAVGGLDSFLVRGGTVTIDGAGLDASKTDYAAVLARAVQLNAAIYATDLKVVTGANQISADHAQITPTTGAGAAPTFALDVAALGGMYAGKIVLLGTEQGLGVRNAGNIGASAGSLVVTASGRLENTGTLEGQSVQLASTGGDIVNRGTIRQTSMASLSLSAPTISNTQGGWIGSEPPPPPTSTPTTGGSDGGNPGTGTTAGTGSSGSTGTTTSTGGTTTGGTSAPAATPIEPGRINAAGAFRNDGGKVYAGGPITLQTANLLNNGGTLSVASLALSQPTFSNQGGTINVSGAFTANLGSFDNSSGTLRTGSLDITTSGDLNNQDGVLTSDGNANLTVGGSANNLRGNVSAAGALAASVTGATVNSSGTLASNQGLTLNTGSLENTKGNIQSAQAGVRVTSTGQLVNGGGGSIKATADLGVQAGVLTNAGTLRGENDVSVAVAGTLVNDGNITSGRNATITAASVQSSKASVLGAGIKSDGTLGSAGDLHVASTGALVAKGTQLAAGNATLQGASVDLSASETNGGNVAITATQGDVNTNSATVTTPGTLSITAASALSNIGGTLGSNSGTLVNAASLSNASGTIAAVAGDLHVATTGATDNTSGSLLASGAVVLANGGLTNTDGKASGSSLAIDTHGGALVNTRGTLSASGTLDMNSGAISNDAGLIQSGGAMAIDTHGGALVNTNAAGYANGLGGIVSGDTLTLKTGNVNNTAGFIGSKSALSANTGEFVNGKFVNSDAGVVLSQSTLSINTQGAAYDNKDGQTLAAGDLLIDAGAGAAKNTGGLIRSGAKTTVRAASLDNTATSGTDQGIEGQNVAITAATVKNTSGAIRADVNTTLTSTALVENGTGGLISAGDTVSVVDPNAANPATKTLSVSNSGGTMLAGKSLTVNVASLTSSGKLLSQGDLNVAATQNIALASGSETIANHDLGIATSGNLSNSGRIASGDDLSLSAANIDNKATGDIQGTTTRLSTSGTVTNRGVIDGTVTRIDADTLTNIGTGRIYGNQISIAAGTLNNQAETVNGPSGATASAATIAARVRLDLGVGTLNNEDGALIFSDGSPLIGGGLFIGGGLDALGHATGTATSVNNRAATIEATGDVDIKTTTLNNTNGGVTWTLQPGESKQVVEYTLPGSSTRYKAEEVLISFGGLQQFPDTGWNSWNAASAANPLTAGSDPYARLLVPSPDYPLAQFRAYYMQSPASSQDRSYQTCGGGEGTACDTTNVAGAWYSRTNPIWATFGVTPPGVDLPMDFIGRKYPDMTVGQAGVMVLDETNHDQWIPFDHPVTQAEYDQWQDYRQAHAALDKATLKFIHTIAGYTSLTGTEYEPGRMASTYDAYVYSVTPSTPVLQSSAPGKIIAGGAMKIAVGSGVNDMSQILAGGALTVTGGTIVNKGLTVDAPTVQTGTVSHSYVEAHSGDDVRVYQIAPYNLTTNSTVTLAAARQEGNVAVAVGNPGTGGLSVGQTGTGPQAAGSVAGSAIVNPIIQVPTNSGPGNTAGTSGPTVVRTSAPNVAIPSASLFRTLADPSSRYLIETDPRFANYRNWLSSDYLLNNLGLDPNNTLKRLGDGFYEERLIREQVAQLTGYRYLDGFTSDDAQYSALMNAGAAFAQQYGLRVGVALTAAQMAQLTSDIVWLVEQAVTLPDGSTQRVLVPQVYVRVKPGDIDGSGAVLSGGSVDMRFSGDLTNAGGTIAGRHAVSLSADNINNVAGRITGEDVTVSARTDINVIGAQIDASKSLTAIAGRDINVVTTTRDSKSDTGPLARSSADSGVNLSATTLDRVAGLYVTNPGGSLNVVAVRDANLIGAEIKSAGDATVVAGRDVNLGTVTTGRTEDIRWSSDNTRKDESSQEIGTTISGAGNVSVGAGRNLTGVAATLNAGETLELSAGAKLTLVAGQNSTSSASKDSQKDGLSHSSSSADGQETSLTRTTLTGKNIQLTSGDDMTLSAIEANAESLGIQAGGKLNLLTQTTTSAFSGSETDGDGAWVSAKSAGHKDETSQYNLFNVQSLNIKANGGVTAQVGQNANLADLAKQPGMAWVNQLTSDPALANSVEWQRVQEEHKKWAQSQTTMGPVAALVVSVVVGMVAGPVAAQAGGAASGAATSAGLGTTISAGVGSAVQIGVTAIASRAAVSFVNNDGDIGKVLKELGSSESIKNIATAMVTAGVLQGLSEVLPENLARATNGAAKLPDQLQRQLIDGAATAVIRSAINGTSLEAELRAALTDALLNTVAAQSAYGIGTLAYNGDINAFTQNVLHAIAGCAVGAVRADNASGCGAGALGAVIGELTASTFGRDEYGNVLPGAVEMTQVLAAIAGAVAGLDANGIYVAAGSSANAAINNALSMRGSTKFKSDLRACSDGTGKTCDVDKLREEMTRDTDKQTARIKSACSGSGSLDNCTALANSANLTLNNLIEASFYADTPEKRALVDDLIGRQLSDMTDMYQALAKQQSTAGFADLLKTAIAGALPIVGPGVGTMLGTKLGATGSGVKVPSGTSETTNIVTGSGELTGTRTPIPPRADAPTTRSLIRENESAEILANKGYKVEQNPKVDGPKNPDYKINGEIFDNYAPSTDRPRNAAGEINGKVQKQQADNIVVNLIDSPITPAALREQLTTYPIPGLRKVIIIDRTGKVTEIRFMEN
ncbi:Haemagluttinin repeat-containing protein [Variovorax sp. NFACC28]|uniref:two-partner secretion domain-containing protein n=2 Tax=Variovorax TaxID=34072 RepID=UPI0008946DB8|nr:Haemagluttinin repeat-containing protein [Variovorax sp. NFACC28]SEG79700.1 Haemagluttinin repeat-containing protein [Variovorax sp. NFACC29]SFC92006.1 Haemagluttinin repeat-containing protein [Variovorax sp. NFACC26]SFG06177.1 Haemagluttinin repeat-containing protein [Variovorax sp. NFACC27]